MMGVVVGNKKGGQGVQCPRPRRGRNRRPADGLWAERCVDREGERKYWMLEKIVSGEETEGRT